MAPAIAAPSPRPLASGHAGGGPLQSPGDGEGPIPDWMVDCDLVTCQVLQEVSAQIVANCKTFGVQLGGVCGNAIERLPAEKKMKSDANPAFNDYEACSGFLSMFGCLSQALLQLAVDLESTVTVPLQSAIATLTEESVGRVKHWRQVRSRLIELQERYGRSRQRSAEARGKLASSAQGGWFQSKSTGKKAAAEQHSAMCDLARCEEELRESEASLRRLEDESRERLQQLESEKRVLLQGVLTKGARSLRSLRFVADKAPDTPPEPLVPEEEQGDSWQGVMPQVGGVREESALDGAGGAIQAKLETEPEQQAPSEVVPSDPCNSDAARKEAEEAAQQAATAAVDPSSKYLPGSGKLGHVADAEFQELAELGGFSDSEEEDATSRALNWSPPTKPAASGGGASRKFAGASGAVKRSSTSLIFQSGDPLLVARPSAPSCGHKAAATVAPQAAAASSTASTSSINFAAAPPQNSLLYQAAAAAASSFDTPRVGDKAASCRTPSKPCHGAIDLQLTPSTPGVAVGTSSSSNLAAVPPRAAEKPGSKHVEDSDDEDDDVRTPSRSSGQFSSRPVQQILFEVSPVVAEDPRKCFERYSKRLSERMWGATETAWERLQARSAEQPPGAFVGKLDFFWILRPGAVPSPETASGMVCFQFVQGFASNFARILHLSLTGPDPQRGRHAEEQGGVETSHEDALTWSDAMPSALGQVRQFIFGTLDVVSIRSIVMCTEDPDGLIYVDRDVEAAYHQSRFRWFQLTQNVRRTRSALTGRKSVKPFRRFLVLHSSRGEGDPAAPRNRTMDHMPAMVLRDEPQGTAFGGAEPQGSNDGDDVGPLPVFNSI